MDFSSIISTANAALAKGKTKPAEWRRGQLRQLIKMLDENEEEMALAMHKDLRKPRNEAITYETEYTKNVCRGLLNGLDEYMADEYVAKNALTLLDTTFIHREPYGLVLIIGPWNFPVQLSLVPMAGAIAAGNAVIIKPSELAPATAEVVRKTVNKYLDPECVRVVCGGIPETTELLRNKFDYIFYTGSGNVGKIIGAAAAKNITPCTLELGGKSPVYMDESCDMKMAAKRLIWGKTCNGGQVCVAPDYLICTERVRDEFLRLARDQYKEFFGDDAQASPDLGRMINERNFDRVRGMLEKTKGRVVFGGEKIDRDDLFIELTIVADVTRDDSVMQEEIFGPILPILTVSSLDEAIDVINAGDKPLSLYIMSTKKSVQDEIIARTSSGSVCVNDLIVQLSVETLPFGGVGASGHGAYHGKYTFDTFSHRKSVLKRDFGFVGEYLGLFRYPPYTDAALRRMRLMLMNRAMPSVGWLKHLLLMVLGAAAYVGLKAAMRAAEVDLPEWM